MPIFISFRFHVCCFQNDKFSVFCFQFSVKYLWKRESGNKKLFFMPSAFPPVLIIYSSLKSMISDFIVIYKTLSWLNKFLPSVKLTTSKWEGGFTMSKIATETECKPSISSKIHRHLKELPKINISLKDVQKSLSDIGISLSKRIIEEREKR